MATLATPSLTTVFTRITPLRGSIKAYIGLARSRRALSKLDAQALRDIGLTASQANQEANRSVWDVPTAWKI